MKKKVKVYRYNTGGESKLVRVRNLRGAFAEIREPKGGYRLGRSDLLAKAKNTDEALFALLDH
jgi:hypothetical protein